MRVKIFWRTLLSPKIIISLLLRANMSPSTLGWLQNLQFVHNEAQNYIQELLVSLEMIILLLLMIIVMSPNIPYCSFQRELICRCVTWLASKSIFILGRSKIFLKHLVDLIIIVLLYTFYTSLSIPSRYQNRNFFTVSKYFWEHLIDRKLLFNSPPVPIGLRVPLAGRQIKHFFYRWMLKIFWRTPCQPQSCNFTRSESQYVFDHAWVASTSTIRSWRSSKLNLTHTLVRAHTHTHTQRQCTRRAVCLKVCTSWWWDGRTASRRGVASGCSWWRISRHTTAIATWACSYCWRSFDAPDGTCYQSRPCLPVLPATAARKQNRNKDSRK